jgi:hypothetical protein
MIAVSATVPVAIPSTIVAAATTALIPSAPRLGGLRRLGRGASLGRARRLAGGLTLLPSRRALAVGERSFLCRSLDSCGSDQQEGERPHGGLGHLTFFLGRDDAPLYGAAWLNRA